MYREKYSELWQITKVERFAKIVNGFQSLSISAKHSMLDIWQGFKYASVYKSFQLFKSPNIEYPPLVDFHLNNNRVTLNL